MNKLLLTAIILVNALTIYYANYYTISDTDATTYRLADISFVENSDALAAQNDILAHKLKNIYGDKWQKKRIIKVDTVQKIYKPVFKTIHKIRRALSGHFMEAYGKKTTHEQVYQKYTRSFEQPQQILQSENQLSQLLQTIETAQAKLFNYFHYTDWINDWLAEHQIDTTQLKADLSQASATHLNIRLNLLQQHCQFAINQCYEALEADYIPPMTYDNILPIVRANKDKINLGETYEAEVFLSHYGVPSSDSLVQIKVNGNAIPMQSGIGYFETPTKRLGKHKYKVEYTFQNPYWKTAETFERTFEYEVIDCK